MIRKEIRNEREANMALQAREIPTLTFHPNFMKAAPKRAKPSIIKTRTGILATFSRLIGR